MKSKQWLGVAWAAMGPTADPSDPPFRLAFHTMNFPESVTRAKAARQFRTMRPTWRNHEVLNHWEITR